MFISKRNISYSTDHMKELMIKEAASKQQVREAFLSKYKTKDVDQRKIISFADQYREKRKSEPGFQELSYEDLYNQIPDDIMEIISFLRNTDKGSIEKLKELGLKVDENTRDGIVKYLTSRYIDGVKNEIHPANEALDALNQYFKNIEKANLFYKNDSDFSEFLEERGILNINDLENLTVDDILLISDVTEKKNEGKSINQTSINTNNVKIKAEEKIHTFDVDGETWNLWLPLTQETSAKIAQYDQITKEPKTQWCTARTFGSNLFYNYTLSEIYNKGVYLFYIIKENAKEDDDWLSIGFVDNIGGDGGKFDFSGRNGGLSVNRINKGLKREDFERILKSSLDHLLDIIKNKAKSFNGVSPVKKEFIKLTDDIRAFKQLFFTKSSTEKTDLCLKTIEIRGKDEIESVRISIEYLAENDPKTFMEKFTILNYNPTALSIRPPYNENLILKYIDIALNSLSEKEPKLFMKDYFDIKKLNNEIYNNENNKNREQIAIQALIKKDPILFLTEYIYNEKNKFSIDDIYREECFNNLYSFSINEPLKFIDDICSHIYGIIYKPYLITEKAKVYFISLISNIIKNIIIKSEENTINLIEKIKNNSLFQKLLNDNIQKEEIIESISLLIENYIYNSKQDLFFKKWKLSNIDNIYFLYIKNLDLFFNNYVDNNFLYSKYEVENIYKFIDFLNEKNKNLVSKDLDYKLAIKLLTSNPELIEYFLDNKNRFEVEKYEYIIKFFIDSYFNSEKYNFVDLLKFLKKNKDTLDIKNILNYIDDNYKDYIVENNTVSNLQFIIYHLGRNKELIKENTDIKNFIIKYLKLSLKNSDYYIENSYTKRYIDIYIKQSYPELATMLFDETYEDTLAKSTSIKNNKLLKLSRSLYKLGFFKESLQILKF